MTGLGEVVDQLADENKHCTGFQVKGTVMTKKNKVVIKEIPLNKIKLGRNSRMNVTDDEIAGLMESIKEEGLLQPIGVVPRNGGYEICFGNRRFLATSKLGLTTIPAMVFANAKDVEVDMKNLTENIQRRNLSLTEAGRYIVLLQEQGLTIGEVAVRLGVSKSYVDAALQSFLNVPKEFRNDLEMQIGGKKLAPGKIGMMTARNIVNAQKRYHLKADDVKTLFKAAKHDEKFNPANVDKYAQAMKGGKKNPIKSVAQVKTIAVHCLMAETEYERIYSKYVENGHYTSVSRVLRAIISGHLSTRVALLDKRD